MYQEPIISMIGPGLFALEHKTITIIGIVESVKILIMHRPSLPKFETTQHLVSVLFLHRVKSFLSIDRSIHGTFQKNYSASNVGVGEAGYEVDREGHLRLIALAFC